MRWLRDFGLQLMLLTLAPPILPIYSYPHQSITSKYKIKLQGDYLVARLFLNDEEDNGRSKN